MIAPKEIRGSMTEILPRFPLRILPRMSLSATNIGAIPSKIAPRFWPPGICFLARILLRFALGIPVRFWLPGICFPARLWLPGFFLLCNIRGRIPVRFWPPGISLPGKSLAGIPPGIKNPGGQNLAGILVGFPLRLQQDPVKIPVLILQWKT